MGIQVARFENDPGGIVQNQIVKYLKRTINENDLEGLIDAQAMPRTIIFNLLLKLKGGAAPEENQQWKMK